MRHAPRAPRGRRHAWACLSGAVRPERAVGAAFVLPCADAAATGLHLAEIGRHAAPGAQGVVVLEGAGWHAAAGPDVPDNFILLPLPSYASELDAVENVREYPRLEQARPAGPAGLRGHRRHLRSSWALLL